MASEAERQAARIAIDPGLSAAEKSKRVAAIFNPVVAGPLPTPEQQLAETAGSPVIARSLKPGEIPKTNAAVQLGNPTVAPAAEPVPAPGAITLPETTVAPRAGLPGTVPGPGGGVPGPGRPTAGPAPWLRNAVSPTGDLRGAPTESDQFQADFDQAMADQGFAPEGGTPRTAEEIAAAAKGDPGLRPHTPGVPETPDEAIAANEIADEQFKAATGQAEAGEQATQDVLAKHKEQLDQQAEIDAENAKRQADRFADLEKAETSYRSLADAVQNEPIDSARLWNNKTTGEKVLSKLAIFLGTLGSGLAGTPNVVWESMQADIDRDIDAQKSNKALQQSRLAAEGTLFGMAKDRFQDEAMADASMREAAYGRMARELEHFEQTARTPERKQAIAGLRAVAEEKYMAAQQARRMRTDAYVLEQERLRRAAMARPDPLAAEVKRSGQKRQILENTAAGAKAGREIEGGGAAVDPKVARKAEADYQANLAAINEYERTNKNLGLTSSLRDRDKAEFAQRQVATAYQNEFLGKSEEDARIAQKTFPVGGATTRAETVAEAAAAARAAAKRKRDQVLQGGGATPAATSGFEPKTEAAR